MNAHQTSFPVAELDRIGRATTQFTIGLTFLVPAGIGLASGSVPLLTVMILISVVTMGLSWAMAPASYEVAGRILVVHRRAWRDWSTTLEGLSRHKEPGRLGIRVGGSGGVFGWYGRFRRRDLGIIRAYLTTREEVHIIGLDTSKGLVVISPKDRRGMLRSLKKALR